MLWPCLRRSAISLATNTSSPLSENGCPANCRYWWKFPGKASRIRHPSDPPPTAALIPCMLIVVGSNGCSGRKIEWLHIYSYWSRVELIDQLRSRGSVIQRQLTLPTVYLVGLDKTFNQRPKLLTYKMLESERNFFPKLVIGDLK